MEDEGIRACCALYNTELTMVYICSMPEHCALQTGVLLTFPSHLRTSGANQSPQKPDKSPSLISRVSRFFAQRNFLV